MITLKKKKKPKTEYGKINLKEDQGLTSGKRLKCLRYSQAIGWITWEMEEIFPRLLKMTLVQHLPFPFTLWIAYVSGSRGEEQVTYVHQRNVSL